MTRDIPLRAATTSTARPAPPVASATSSRGSAAAPPTARSTNQPTSLPTALSASVLLVLALLLLAGCGTASAPASAGPDGSAGSDGGSASDAGGGSDAGGSSDGGGASDEPWDADIDPTEILATCAAAEDPPWTTLEITRRWAAQDQDQLVVCVDRVDDCEEVFEARPELKREDMDVTIDSLTPGRPMPDAYNVESDDIGLIVVDGAVYRVRLFDQPMGPPDDEGSAASDGCA